MSYLLACKLQAILNTVILLPLIYVLYLTINLVLKVRGDKKIDKRKTLKKILIYSIVLTIIFVLLNMFFKYDPFNMIDEPLGRFVDTLEDIN